MAAHRSSDFFFANLALEASANSLAEVIASTSQQPRAPPPSASSQSRIPPSSSSSGSSAASPANRRSGGARSAHSSSRTPAPAISAVEEYAIQIAELEHRQRVLEKKAMEDKERKARFSRIMGTSVVPEVQNQRSPARSGAPAPSQRPLPKYSTPPSPPSIHPRTSPLAPPSSSIIASSSSFVPQPQPANTRAPSLADLFQKPAANIPQASAQSSLLAGSSRTASASRDFKPPRTVAPSGPLFRNPNPLVSLSAPLFPSTTSNEMTTSELFDMVVEGSVGAANEQDFIPGPAGNVWTTSITSQETPSVLRTTLSMPMNDRSRYGHQGMFCKGPWLALCAHFQLNPIIERDSLLESNNVEAILRQGLGSKTKIDFLALMVVKLRSLEEGAVATLADPTGTIEGEITQAFIKSEANVFTEGCAIVLRNITVFRALVPVQGVASHSVIITSYNVEKIFAVDEPVPPCFSEAQMDEIRAWLAKPGPKVFVGESPVFSQAVNGPTIPSDGIGTVGSGQRTQPIVDRPLPTVLPVPAQQSRVPGSAPITFPAWSVDDEDEFPEEVIALLEGRSSKRARSSTAPDVVVDLSHSAGDDSASTPKESALPGETVKLSNPADAAAASVPTPSSLAAQSQAKPANSAIRVGNIRLLDENDDSWLVDD